MQTTTNGSTRSRPYPDTNSVVLVGKVASAPILKHVGHKNTALVELDVRVNNPRGQASMISVQIWAGGAEAVHKFTSLGDQIVVNGRLRSNIYGDSIATYVDAGTTGIQFTATRPPANTGSPNLSGE